METRMFDSTCLFYCLNVNKAQVIQYMPHESKKVRMGSLVPGSVNEALNTIRENIDSSARYSSY